jgi:3-phenylpropionate/cinnamic acid dioxygenase small subunit
MENKDNLKGILKDILFEMKTLSKETKRTRRVISLVNIINIFTLLVLLYIVLKGVF